MGDSCGPFLNEDSAWKLYKVKDLFRKASNQNPPCYFSL